MNICMHCGFIGNPEDFRKPKGKVCKKCYKKQRSEHRKKNRKEIAKKEKEYREKNREQIAERVSEYYQKNRDYIRQRRKNSYQENHEEELEKQRIRRRKRGILPWTEIKNLRFGLYIEKVVASMFGSVAEEYNNRHVDFICPQGYKIQVKAASMTHTGGKYPTWHFYINKNKVADYFILVAVNNTDDIDKEDFKPIHMWLVEGNDINKKTGVRISLKRISEWDKYSILDMYENKFMSCCTTMKKKV